MRAKEAAREKKQQMSDDEPSSDTRSASHPAEGTTGASRRVYSSLFFGWSPTAGGNEAGPARSSLDEETLKRVRRSVAEALRKRSKEENSTALPFDVADILPQDARELKKTAIYKSAYQQLQYHRDNYLVGRDYANWRQKERSDARLSNTKRAINDLPHDRDALGHAQMASLAKDFIPSLVVRNAALPLVTNIPVNFLLQPATSSMVNLILGQQERLDQIAKQQLIGVLTNANVRHAIKSSTNRFISTQYR